MKIIDTLRSGKKYAAIRKACKENLELNKQLNELMFEVVESVAVRADLEAEKCFLEAQLIINTNEVDVDDQFFVGDPKPAMEAQARMITNAALSGFAAQIREIANRTWDKMTK